MFELLLVIASCVAMAKIASADNKSGIIWGCITFGLCLASGLIPLPFVRVFIAFVVSFILMTASNAIFK